MNERYAKIVEYIETNSLAVLGTVDANGDPHGAVVYIYADSQQPVFYLLTKTGTQKYKNLLAHTVVSLTSFNAADNSTLQARGRSFIVDDAATIDRVMQKMTEIYAKSPEWLPPVAKIRAHAYVVVGVHLDHARLSRFKGEQIGSEHIFTEL